MKQYVAFVFIFFSCCYIFSQISNVQEEFALPNGVSESSGAIYVNKKLVTHTDSGGENKLYEITLDTEMITRVVSITNATNVDWEAIAQDETHIFIGDFGNNNGTRTDLKIYKILKSDFNSSTSVTAETINFNYANQTDFTSNPQNTEWDAEALISLNSNELVIISKNWVNGISSAYSISKTPGNYAVKPQTTTLNAGGLITGSTFNELSGKIYLSGYTEALQPFVWTCDGFNENNIFSGENTSRNLSELSLEQIEGITQTSVDEYLLTSESFSFDVSGFNVSDYAKVITFRTSDVILTTFGNTIKDNLELYPNPVLNNLFLNVKNLDYVEIFTMQSASLYSGNSTNIDMSQFSAGFYVVKVNFKDKTSVVRHIVKQ